MDETGSQRKRTLQIPETGNDLIAAGKEAVEETLQAGGGGLTFFDLAAAEKVNRNMVGPQISITYRGYVGIWSTRGIEQLQGSAKGRRMTTVTPKGLKIHFDENESRVIYGVPVARAHPSALLLEWSDRGKVLRSNFQAILQAKEIEIIRGMRMVIKVEHVTHPVLKDCVKLSWDDASFVPVNEAPEREK